MRWRAPLALVGLGLAPVGLGLALAACASSPEARRTEEARRARCAAIELVPAGVVPSRPYQVLGPVSAGGGPRMGDEALRDTACRLGADAVINVQEDSPAEYAPSGPGALFDERRQVSGTAVVYTDGGDTIAK